MKQQYELLLCKNLLFSLLIVNFCNIECVQWLLHTGGSKFMIMLAVYLKNVMMLLAVYWENNSWITLLSGSTPGSWSCKQCEAETRTASLLEFRINCAICCALIVNFLCMSQYRLYWEEKKKSITGGRSLSTSTPCACWFYQISIHTCCTENIPGSTTYVLAVHYDLSCYLTKAHINNCVSYLFL